MGTDKGSGVVYQFDDESLAKFAKSIADSVSARYLRRNELTTALIQLREKDPWLFRKLDNAVIGEDWSQSKLLPGKDWHKIIFADVLERFIAISTDTVAVSADAVFWEYHDLPVSAQWCDIACSDNGILAMVAFESNLAAYSEDGGISWNTTNMPSSEDTWRAITYGNGVFVAISNNTAAYSNDGITWNDSTMPNDGKWTDVIFMPGSSMLNEGDIEAKFVAAGIGDTTAYSTDGKTWLSGKLNNSANWTILEYGDGYLVAISLVDNAGVINYSNDGITWYDLPNGVLPECWHGIAYGASMFILIAAGTTVANIINFSRLGHIIRNFSIPIDIDPASIASGMNMFVILSTDGTILYSGIPIQEAQWGGTLLM